MQAPLVRAHVLPADLLPATHVRAVEQLIVAILVHMGLHVSPRENLLAPFAGVRTPHLDVVAHADQQTRHVQDALDRCAAGRAREAGRAGVEGGVDGGVHAFVAEYMVTLQANGLDERAVTDGTHEVFVILGHVVQRAQVDHIFSLLADIHVAENLGLDLVTIRN